MPDNALPSRPPTQTLSRPLTKPLVVAAALATTAACAWAGLTVYTGRSVERTLNAEYDKLAELPFVKVLERRYDRGFTSATSEMKLAIGWPERTLSGANGANGTNGTKAGFELSVRHRIANGPFAGGGVAAARIDTELVVPQAFRSQIATLFDNRAPLTATTLVGFGGDTTTTLELAPIRIDDSVLSERASQGWKPGGRFEWKGVKVVSKLSADQEHLRYTGSFGPMTMVDPDGGEISTSEARFEGKGKRIEGWLYDDANTMKMQSISMRTPAIGASPAVSILMSDITGTSTTAVKDGYLGQQQKLRFASMKVGEREIGRLDYDTSMERLHLKTLTDGVKAALAKRPFDCIGLPEDQVPECVRPTLEVLKPMAFALLKHEPRFAVDRLALVVPEGEARIDYAVNLGAIEEADFDNPMLLVNKIGVIANASFGEAVISRFAAMAMAQVAGGEAPPPEQLKAMIDQGAQPLISQGFVNRADGKLSTSFEMKNGAMKINGKAIDPALTASAMGALAQSGTRQGLQDREPRSTRCRNRRSGNC